jgi:hypothetical protein
MYAPLHPAHPAALQKAFDVVDNTHALLIAVSSHKQLRQLLENQAHLDKAANGSLLGQGRCCFQSSEGGVCCCWAPGTKPSFSYALNHRASICKLPFYLNLPMLTGL